MSEIRIPLSVNFGETICMLTLSLTDYLRLKAFLFVDDTAEPRVVKLGTMIDDNEQGGFNIVEFSFLSVSAYELRLELQKESAKKT